MSIRKARMSFTPSIRKVCLKRVAYFSMEFGLSESLLIYSGGLGMLAGDHLKTASDLGVPMGGIGLLYQQGYFRQVIAEDGKQLVRQMTQFLSQPERSGRAMFLEDYDMNVARHMVSGVDIWLNTPRVSC